MLKISKLIVKERSDDSFIKRDFLKISHQPEVDINNENQNIKFYFGENLYFTHIGNGYLKVDVEVRKAGKTIFTKADEIVKVKNGLDFIFREGGLSTSSGTET